MSDIATAYPVSIQFNPPDRIARWRPHVHWLLAIPHIIVLYVLNIISGLCLLVARLSGVITGKVPQGLLEIIAMQSRYGLRVNMYMLFLTDQYPPFSFETSLADNGSYTASRLDVAAETEGRNRLTIFFRYFMIIPQIFVLFFVIIALYFVMIAAWFAVIILGRWPAGLRNFVIGYLGWIGRVSAYFSLLTDKYPPFGLS